MSANADTIVVARAPGQTRPAAPSRGTTRNSRRSSTPTSHRRDAPAHRSRRQVRPPSPPGPPRATPRARTGVFVAVILVVLTVGLLAMLWINTTLAQGAFVLSDLQQQRATLIESEQQLSEDLSRAEAPAQVEEAARALGMVPQDVPVFLRLEDGQILGNPIPQPAPITEEPITEDVVTDDVVIEDVTTDDAVNEDAVNEDAVTEEVVTDEVATENEVTEDVVTEDVVVDEGTP